MHQITVVSLGPGSPDLLTLGALKQMKRARHVILRTARHGAAALLAREGIAFDSLDSLYEQSLDFETLTRLAAEQLMDRASRQALTYAVPDPNRDETVRRLLALAGGNIRILPGVALETAMISQRDPAGSMLTAVAVDLVIHNAQQPLCVVELDSRRLASEVKLKVMGKYGEEAEILFFPPSESSVRKGLRLPLCELDRQPRYDHTAGFIVFPSGLLEKTAFDPEDLLALMQRLRAPDGCPWDREQTHQSLAKYLVEEANEASCALMEENWEEAADELGDVFLQLAFHAVMGEEYATFTWGDMLRAICRKLIRRHPHVFGELKLDTSGEVLKNWDLIKQKEHSESSPGEAMGNISKGLASLLRAEKVQKLAARAGFDWNKPEETLEKVHEEADELADALRDGKGAEEELGDLLFSCVNTARLMGLSADEALKKATDKFIRRFARMENEIKNENRSLNMLTINDFGVYWERSKG